MQPTRILPDLQCCLLCEQVRQEANGNFFLIGVLDFLRVPQLPVTAWGMLYGALSALAVGVASGSALAFDTTPAYLLSLAYLALLGSIAAFASYLTLLKRIGAARAGYIGVMVPVVALLLSAVFEGFRFHPLTWAGIAISVAGNVLILRRAA